MMGGPLAPGVPAGDTGSDVAASPARAPETGDGTGVSVSCRKLADGRSIVAASDATLRDRDVTGRGLATRNVPGSGDDCDRSALSMKRPPSGVQCRHCRSRDARLPHPATTTSTRGGSAIFAQDELVD